MKNNLILPLFTIILMVFPYCAEAQDQSIQRTFIIADQARSYYEGFLKNTGKNEFTYQSLRDEITTGMLTRCTDGTMAIEWETSAIPRKLTVKD